MILHLQKRKDNLSFLCYLMLLNIQFCRSLVFQKYDPSWSHRYPGRHNWCFVSCCLPVPHLSPCMLGVLRVNITDPEEFVPKAGNTCVVSQLLPKD